MAKRLTFLPDTSIGFNRMDTVDPHPVEPNTALSADHTDCKSVVVAPTSALSQ